MKDFFKYTLATVTGFFLTLFLVFMLGMVLMVGLFATAESEVKISKPSVLHLKLSGQLLERTVDNPLRGFLLNSDPKVSLEDVLNSIKKAKENENIKGIYFETSTLYASSASVEAIRSAFLDFKSTGKFIVAYGDSYSQGQYYIASVADKIYLNPSGHVNWIGLSAQPVFYTDLLKNIGVEMQIFKVGTYKSAVEPFTETKMSEASREQTRVFLNDVWSHIVANVSLARGISEDKLQSYADGVMMMQPAQYTVDAHFVDSLVYKMDVDSLLKLRMDEEKLRLLSYKEMKNVSVSVNLRDKVEGSIAIYYAQGDIVDNGTPLDNQIVGNKVIRDLKKLEENEDIKAVVLRVNSPGGSAYASEQIWKAVVDLKAKKPVVVSMGDYAASGGYYISAAADCIVAEPTTLTGSIGIFAMIPNVGKLTDAVGLNFDVVKTNEMSDFGSIYRNFNPNERALIQNNINLGYNLFVKRCADGRSVSEDAIREIAEGRVWTGLRAKELGLVDELGGLDKAVEIAATKAEITTYRKKTYPRQPDFMEQLLELSSQSVAVNMLGLGRYTDLLEQATRIKQMTEESNLQARVPYVLNIKSL